MRLTQTAEDAERAIQARALADGRRHIQLAGMFNLRDVGGYPSEGGGTVRWRTLLRSDALHRLDAGGVATLASLQLRTIVDLRTHVEAEIAPSALDELGARTTQISLLGGALQGLPLELGAIYQYVVDQCGGTIAQSVRLLCAEGALPALVHCSAGKDRTGIVIALVLAVLGVPDELIAADYALSSSFLDPDHTAAIGQLQASTGLKDKLTTGLLASPPNLILDVLARARASGGSVEGYLIAHGILPAELTALRLALTDQP